MDDYFWVLYGAEGLDYKTTTDPFFNITTNITGGNSVYKVAIDRIFNIISNITGVSYETIWKKYRSLENGKFIGNKLGKIWDIYMNKYFNLLVKKK